jgi:hypothetical protein
MMYNASDFADFELGMKVELKIVSQDQEMI